MGRAKRRGGARATRATRDGGRGVGRVVERERERFGGGRTNDEW